jgi:hypothetical protein
MNLKRELIIILYYYIKETMTLTNEQRLESKKKKLLYNREYARDWHRKNKDKDAEYYASHRDTILNNAKERYKINKKNRIDELQSLRDEILALKKLDV